MRRRVFLTSLVAVCCTSWALRARDVVAQAVTRIWPPRPRQAFATKTLDATFQTLFGEREIRDTDKVKIVAAKLAENGAVVPVKVDTEFEHAKCITLIASKNPIPLVAQFSFSSTVKPFIATRIKLAESSEIIAVVETDEGLFQARRFVEVTIGGCGA